VKVCYQEIICFETILDTNFFPILEERFRQKCKELKKRVLEVEQTNEVATIALSRTQASIRRLRLEYAVLIERLEERAHHLPDGVTNFEEMAGPPTPSILDESLVKTSKNGTNKKSNKKPSTGKVAVNPSSSPAGAGAKNSLHIASNATTSSADHASTIPVNPALAKSAKHRDPDLPKRPTNAYLLFCEQEKERLRQQQQEDPENNTRDLSKAMTEAWKKLSEEDKQPFYKLYEEDRIRYQKEMVEYTKKKDAELGIVRADDGSILTGGGGTDANEEEDERAVEELENNNEDERETKRQKTDDSIVGSETEHHGIPKSDIKEESGE